MKYKKDKKSDYHIRVSDSISNDIQRLAFNTKRRHSEVLRDLLSIALDKVYR